MNPLTWEMPKVIVYVLLWCIVFCRAFATYGIGRAINGGLQKFEGFREKMATPAYARAVDLVSRYGPPVVSLCFFTVGFQTLVLLASGAMPVPLRRFVPALAVGAVFWSAIYGTIGFAGFAFVAFLWRTHRLAFIAVVSLVILALVAYVVVQRRRELVSSVQSM